MKESMKPLRLAAVVMMGLFSLRGAYPGKKATII